QGDKDGALAVISKESLLPAICGRVCPQERQCEEKCIRKLKLGGSVAIGALERYVGDYGLQKGAGDLKPAPSCGKKVAVVGSGPSGLACAADCAQKGMQVTIFEAFHKAGGVLVYGIPEFRLPKEKVVAKEIDKLKALGVEIKLNMVVGKTITMQELQDEFDAIFIGVGAGLPMFMNIPGENLNGVYSANEFLTRVNLMQAYKADSVTPVYCGKRVAVVGAGNVAMDACRTAKRIGGGEVYIIYRRSREEMPAREEEIVHAQEEGIKFCLLTNPVEILGENGRVCGLKCVRMELGAPDQSGRRSPVVIPNSE
ncbi:MAG: FAD-dependent oxidoreductase, partial [Clostridia bacterium]